MKLSEHVTNWRRLMATTPAEARPETFRRAAAHLASLATTGKLRAAAADELIDMAIAHGFGDVDEVHAVIARALAAPPNGHAANGHFRSDNIALLYTLPEVANMPHREWLFAGHYGRGTVSCTVAPGGFGKTTLLLYELLSMAASGIRTWYISGEDPRLELDRRIAAHCQHHGIDGRRAIVPNLFVNDQSSFALAIDDNEWLERLEKQIELNAIDVVALDPFVAFHYLPENDNSAIGGAVKALAAIAQTTQSAIELSHHSRKIMAGNELTVDDSRGGSAIINAVRSARVINRMTDDEAALAKIEADRRSLYLRVDAGKRNMAPPEKAAWWRLVSVALPNGDNVQAIEPYTFPDAFGGISSADVEWVQSFLRVGGPRRASSQSEDWLGHDLGRHCGRNDTHEKAGVLWANRIIGQWLKNGVFRKVELRDEFRKKKSFYATNDFAAPDD